MPGTACYTGYRRSSFDGVEILVFATSHCAFNFRNFFRLFLNVEKNFPAAATLRHLYLCSETFLSRFLFDVYPDELFELH